MQLIPAIDIQNGQCVRLYQGSFDNVTHYSSLPVEVAKNYQKQGADLLHVVDLEGARYGKPIALEYISDLTRSVSLKFQVGGGIRTRAQILYYLNQGVSRVVIGSLAVTQPALIKDWLKEFSDKLVLALDVKCDNTKEPFIVTQAWQQQSKMSLWSLLELYQEAPLQSILCTDIEKDGALTGPNFSLYETCQRRYPQLKWQASGGIHTLEDLKILKKLNLDGVIIGKALYENKFTFNEAMEAIKPC